MRITEEELLQIITEATLWQETLTQRQFNSMSYNDAKKEKIEEIKNEWIVKLKTV